MTPKQVLKYVSGALGDDFANQPMAMLTAGREILSDNGNMRSVD
jgi:hypothetical protein